MNTVYSKLNRLKGLGWTWEQLLGELDKISVQHFDLKTIKANTKHPHRKSNTHLTSAVNLLYAKNFPSIFPAAIESLLNVSNFIASESEQFGGEKAAQDLEVFILWMLEHQDSYQPLELARIWWVYGNLSFDRITYYRDNPNLGGAEEEKEKSIFRFKQALTFLDQINLNEIEENQIQIERYKLVQNILACHFNVLRKEDREESKEWKLFLQECEFFMLCENLLTNFPYEWLIARNALRLASLLKDDGRILQFYSLLCDACAAFKSFDYKPNHYPALSESLQFEYAIKVIKLQTIAK